jgi:WD40 repeat protein
MDTQQSDAGPAPRRHLIITVHGIRTFGHWQERLEALVRGRDPDARTQHYKYGYFSCAAFMIPALRWWVTRQFRRALVEACAGSTWDRIDIVCHSFGTHLVAWGLHGIPRGRRPRIHTLILAGSVLKPSFPWAELTADCVGRVVNDCGTKDGVLVLNQAVVLFTGMAGRVGFAGMSHDRFRNRYFALGHSGYFVRDGRADDEFMRTWWLPALTTDAPCAVPDDPRTATLAQGLASFALNNAEPIKMAVVLAPVVALAIVYLGLYREADSQREEALRRLVALQVSNAETSSNADDVATSLVWYAQALHAGGAAAERDQRVRFATALRRHPRLMHMLFLDESNPNLAEFSPDGAALAITVGNYRESGVKIWDVATGAARTPMLAHENTVNSIAFSPDGARVATASSDLTARVWDARSGAPVTAPLEHGVRVGLVRFSPDGERVLTVVSSGRGGANSVQVWNARSGAPVGAAMAHPDEIGDAAFSPDGRRVATICEDGRTRIWNAESGVAARPPIESGEETQYMESRLCVAFSPDGRHLVTSSGSTVQVWNAETGASAAGPWTLRTCSHVEFIDDDVALAVDGAGATSLWRFGNRREQAGPFAHGDSRKASLSASNSRGRIRQRLAAADGDGVRVWDARSARPLTPPLQHSGIVRFARISRDGRRLVTIDAVNTLRIWDLSHPASIELDHGNSVVAADVRSAAFSPDGDLVVTVAREFNSAHVWNAATGERLYEIERDDALECASFSPDSRRVVTGSKDKTARLWEARTGMPLGDAMKHGDRVTVASFSPDGTRLVTGCGDGTVHVWNAMDGSELRAPIKYGPSIIAASFTPDGRELLVAGEAAGRLFDVQTGERISLGPPQSGIGLIAVSLSPDGRRIATGGLDGVARVWDARSGEPITPPLFHVAGPKYANMSQRVNHVEFSPDSRLLATSSSDTTTRIWDAATGAPVAPPIAGADEFASFSPDGRWIATAGTSGVARVWDARTGAALSPPLVHDGPATCAVFDARGLRLLTASFDGTARIWDLSPDERPVEELRCLAELLACRRIDETGGLVELTPEELRVRWESIKSR